MLDILITNGQVVDGTGSAGYYAAVGVTGDTVSIHRGDSSQIEAARTDRRDRAAWSAPASSTCTPTPDLRCWVPRTTIPKVRQGVTTELVGIDGISRTRPSRRRTISTVIYGWIPV